MNHLDDIIETCAQLDARQLDALIQALGLIRAHSEPAVQMVPDDLVQTTDAPAVEFGIRADGRLMLNLRSPAFGWQVFLFSHQSTTAIGLYFRNTAGTAWKEEILTVHQATGSFM